VREEKGVDELVDGGSLGGYCEIKREGEISWLSAKEAI